MCPSSQRIDAAKQQKIGGIDRERVDAYQNLVVGDASRIRDVDAFGHIRRTAGRVELDLSHGTTRFRFDTEQAALSASAAQPDKPSGSSRILAGAS